MALLAALLLTLCEWASRLHAAEALPVPYHLENADPRSKIGSQLRCFLDQASTRAGIDPRLRKLSVATHGEGAIPLRLDLEVTDAALGAITGTGAVITEVSSRWRSVALEATPSQIEALALLPAIRSITLRRPSVHHGQPGTYSNQADSVIHTDQVRVLHGVSGVGQRIGVISDSINDTSAVQPGMVTGSQAPFQLSRTAPQLAGNLPDTISVIDFGSQAEGHSDEGEALIEECYHLAPAAAYAFSADGGSQTGMASNIAALHSLCGCNIIYDDLSFLDEPMFQDGPIAQAAEAFVAAGGVYLAAAGNTSDAGIQMPFNLDALSNLHDWGGGLGDYLPVTISSGTTLTIVLQWSQPYQSFHLGPGSQTDLDLALYSVSHGFPSQLVAASSDTQGTSGAPSGDPEELLQFTNTGQTTTTYDLAIPYRHGGTGVMLRLIASVSSGTFSTPAPGYFTAATSFGHATASDVLSVGAAYYQNPTVLEPFSAKGGWGASGIPFYFDTSGRTLANAPLLRNKPDLVGPDGVHTSVFGTPIGGDPSGLPSFFGTSAATANAAAACALAWCVHPQLTSQRLTTILQQTATDLVTPPAAPGPDAWSGYGMVNALAASSALITSVTSTSITGTYVSGTILVLLTYSAAVEVDTSQGLPSIQLNSAPGAHAIYVGGSGTSQLTFSYVIQQGDVAAALEVAGPTALTLPGSGIRAATPDHAPAIPVLPGAGQPGSLSAGVTIAIAALGPVVTISSQPAIYHLPNFTFQVSFQRPVSGFSALNLVISNGTLVPGSFLALTDGITYQCGVTAVQPGQVVVSVAAGAVHDLAYGYANLAGSGIAVYDITPPTLVITASPSVVENSQDLMVSFTWSKIVQGFTSANLVIVDSDGSAHPLQGGGSSYTLKVIAGSPGILRITVPSGVVADLAGNLLAQSASVEVTVVQGPLPSDSGGHSSCGFGSSTAAVLGGCMLWWTRSRRGMSRSRRGQRSESSPP